MYSTSTAGKAMAYFVGLSQVMLRHGSGREVSEAIKASVRGNTIADKKASDYLRVMIAFQGQDRHAICKCTFLFFMIALNFFLFISSLFFHTLLLVFFYIRVLTSIENFVEIFFSFWIGSSTLTFYGWFDL